MKYKQLLSQLLLSLFFLSSCSFFSSSANKNTNTGSSIDTPSEDNTSKEQGLVLDEGLEVEKFVITFIVENSADGLDEAKFRVSKNSTPKYEDLNGNRIPKRKSSIVADYIFKKWNPSIKPATADATYTAEFETIPKKINIRFIVDSQTYIRPTLYGKIPDFGSVPTKESKNGVQYVFLKWEPDLVEATNENQVYTAVFTQSTVICNVTFDVEGVKTVKQFPYGSLPEYGSTPTKTQDVANTYTFTGWEPELVQVTQDAYYTAVFTPTRRKYKISFKVDGTITTKEFEYGTKPSYGSIPTKISTTGEEYVFEYWQTDNNTFPLDNLPNVIGPATYEAIFKLKT